MTNTPAPLPDEPSPADSSPRKQVSDSSGTTTTDLKHGPEAVLASLATISAEFSSPFPPPEMLRQYGEVIPGLPDRLVKMVEDESKHRRAQEAKVLQAQLADMEADRRERCRGQVLGFVIGITAIIAGSIVAGLGYQAAGAIIGGTGVTGLTAVFVLGRYWESSSKPADQKPADKKDQKANS